jgi:hypothetical protein
MRSSETSVTTYIITRRHKPEDQSFHFHCREAVVVGQEAEMAHSQPGRGGKKKPSTAGNQTPICSPYRVTTDWANPPRK